MKKVGTLTFHASYNHGSELQAYALQKHVSDLSKKINYSIINLRTEIQKQTYNYKKQENIIKRIIKKLIIGNSMQKRQLNFENFMKEKMNLTKEYSSSEELKNSKLDFDYYITGSDQIWNTSAVDFDWAYYLDFVKKGKRISYATSIGPIKRDINNYTIRKITELVNQYDALSVREQGTFDFIKEHTGIESEINVDPTILLKKQEWEELIATEERIIKEPYILYYTLQPSKSRSLFLKQLGKKMNMKIVVPTPNFKYDMIGGFIKKYESGPLGFLQLLRDADFVVSSSFHGTVFSIIFNKPFYALNGKNDLRISTLLEKVNLEDRAIGEEDSLDDLVKKAYDIEFTEANENLEKERVKSNNYLKKALDIGE